MYKIKQKTEDFVVKEISNVRIKESGKYVYFLLSKKNYNTIKAIGDIAKALSVDVKKLGFAGTKDKVAVTNQMVSVYDCDLNKLNTLKLVDLKIDVRGFGDEPISLGDLEGNRFEIVVRNVNNKPRKVDRVKNYFGEQRFGRNNAEIGKLIIKRKFREAVELISKGEGNYERQVREYMNFSERDYIGALRSIPKKIVMFFIHAYQSKLWNEMAEKSEKDVPIIGFGTEETDAIRIILNREGIGIRDFIIREIPELSAEGGKRDLYVKVNNLVIGELEGDELNPGMKKCRVSFSLGKGSYGTEVVKELFKNC